MAELLQASILCVRYNEPATAERLINDAIATLDDPAYIDPGSPWQNGICESFNGRFRDEFLACEQFHTLLEVQVLAEDWRTEYNTYRPHGSLQWLTPQAFYAQWITNQQPTLS